MARELYLYHYYTHRYAVAYRDMDANDYVCTAKATKPWRVASDGESVTRTCQVTLAPQELARARRMFGKAQRHAPNLTFTTFLEHMIGAYFDHGCGCEHDCCGHYFGGGTAVRLGRRKFSVTIHSSINV